MDGFSRCSRLERFDILRLFGKISRQRVVREAFQPGDDAGGIELRADVRRVRALVGEERRHLFRTRFFIGVGDDHGEVEEKRVVGLGDLRVPLGKIREIAARLPTILVRNGRDQDDGRAFRLPGGDEIRQIPAEGVDNLIGAAGHHVLHGFIADARDIGAIFVGRIADASAVVGAELDDDKIAGFERVRHFLPAALGEKCPRTAPGDGVVDDIDFVRVEIRCDALAPAPMSGAAAAAHGRIADDVKRGQRAVRGVFNGHFRGVHHGTLVLGGRRRGQTHGGGRNAGRLFGKEFCERICLQPLERGDDANGVGLCAGEARVRTGSRDEQRVDFFLAQLVILARDDFVDVEERGVFRLGSLARPTADIIAVAAHRFAIPPAIARYQGTHHRRCALAPGFRDHLPFIPAESVNDLEFSRDHVGDLLRLVADARERAAGAAGVVDRAAVRAELHDDKVAGLQHCQHARPLVAVKRAAGRPAECAVHDIDFAGVEERRNLVAPAPLSACAVAPSIEHGRIANKKQRRQSGFGRHVLHARGVCQNVRCRNRRFIICLRVNADRQRSEKHQGSEPAKKAR